MGDEPFPGAGRGGAAAIDQGRWRHGHSLANDPASAGLGPWCPRALRTRDDGVAPVRRGRVVRELLLERWLRRLPVHFVKLLAKRRSKFSTRSCQYATRF